MCSESIFAMFYHVAVMFGNTSFSLWRSLLDPVPLLLSLVSCSGDVPSADESLQMVHSLLAEMLTVLASSTNIDDPLQPFDIKRYGNHR